MSQHNNRMKIVVIGAVAAGTSVIAKARRNSEEVEIGGSISGIVTLISMITES